MDLLSKGPKLPLSELRNTLIRLEDTITFAFIERAQFKRNETIYKPGAFEFPGNENKSFLEYFLHEVEVVHAKVRRYTSPDEYPFTEDLPEPILKPLDWPSILAKNDINVNPHILKVYVENIVDHICIAGDDLNYGSAATRDVEVLQALSRRIHYGKFIAEAKFQDPNTHEEYIRLIKAKDREGILALLTDAEVERRLLERLRRKAALYGQDAEGGETSARQKIREDLVANTYRDFVIPLTKEVEVLYLLSRLDSD